MHVTLLRAAGAGIVLLLALTTAACGGDDGGSGSNTSNTRAAEAPSPSPSNPPSEADLKKALLVAADLPAGYRIDPDTASEDEPTKVLRGDAGCKKMVALGDKLNLGTESRQAAIADVDFTKGDAGPWVEHAVTSFKAGSAEAVFREYTQAVKKCKKFTFDAEGTPLTFTKKPINSPPTFGEASLVARFRGNILGTPMDVYQVVIRQGDVLVSVDVSGLGTMDPALVTQVSEKAVAKLTQ